MNKKHLMILLLGVALLQTACSSSDDDDDSDGTNTTTGAGGDSSTDASNDDGDTSTTSPVNVNVSEVVMAPEGEVTHYGAVSIADDVGTASDLVGSFYRLDSTVSADFLSSMFDGETTMCQVQDDGTIDFEEISAGFIPTVPGVSATAVSAGESIIVTSPAGTYATLAEQPAAGFIFYDLPSMSMLQAGPVPDGLTIDVPGSSEIPAFSAAAVPAITTLAAASPDGATGITSDTEFTWEPSEEPGAMIRIFTSTAGGFFAEDGITVTCVAPDTGSFTFPDSTRELLGDDFDGAPALISRIAVNTVQTDSTVLYVIRESFR